MKKKSRWFIMLVFLALGSLSCQWLDRLVLSIDGKETEVWSSSASYGIDSQQIMQALERGETNIFTYIGDELGEYDPEAFSFAPVEWEQEDYMDVAQVFFTSIRDESMSNWSVERVNFHQTCEEAPWGPQAMYFHLFKVTQTEKKYESRFEMGFSLAARDHRVEFLEWEMYPNLGTGSSIDLAEIKIPAEDVLRIVEDYQGKEARLVVQNVCNIDITINAGQYDDNWQVTYTGYHGDLLVALIVDSKTGEIVK